MHAVFLSSNLEEDGSWASSSKAKNGSDNLRAGVGSGRAHKLDDHYLVTWIKIVTTATVMLTAEQITKIESIVRAQEHHISSSMTTKMSRRI